MVPKVVEKNCRKNRANKNCINFLKIKLIQVLTYYILNEVLQYF